MRIVILYIGLTRLDPGEYEPIYRLSIYPWVGLSINLDNANQILPAWLQVINTTT